MNRESNQNYRLWAIGCLLFWQACQTGCVTTEITQRSFRVLRVIDGDTFQIMYDGEETSVRLAGCDTPELRGGDVETRRNGETAKEYARERIEGKVVKIRFVDPQDKRDNFGRLLCWVSVGGEDLTKELIAKQLAVSR